MHAVDGNAVDPLHHDDIGAAEVPDHFGDQQQARACKVATQLGGIGGLPNQVELVVQVVVELIDHLAWLEAAAIGGEALHQLGKEPQQGEVLVDDVGHAGPQHLDGHLSAALEPGEVHLRN